MITDHVAALDTDEYKNACNKLRAVARDTMQRRSQEIADFVESDDDVGKAVKNILTPNQMQECGLQQRIHDLANNDEWGDNITLVCLVYAFEISAKLYQVTPTTETDGQVVAHPAISHIARPCNEHMGIDREIYMLHSPSHWQAMLPLEQAKTLNVKGPVVLFEGQQFIVFGIPADNSCQFGAFFWSARQQGLLNITSEPSKHGTDSVDPTLDKFEFLEATAELLAKQSDQLDGTDTTLLARCKPVVLTLSKCVKVDFYRAARHKQTNDLYLTGLKMMCDQEEWVLRNLFYSRYLTSSKTVAFLEHEDGRTPIFKSLQLDNCPVVPCKPYQFATPKCMQSINNRKMTTRIEEYYSDKFRTLVGEGAGLEATEHTSDHVTSSKRATSTRTAISGSASKKARLDDDQMTVLEKELGEVGASRIVLLSVHNFAVCSFCVKTKTELKTEKASHAKLKTAHTKLEVKFEALKQKTEKNTAVKSKTATKPKCGECQSAHTVLTQTQAKLTKAESRIEVLQEQLADLTARKRVDQTDLAPFLTKAMEAGRPDFAGMAALLSAARPHSPEASPAPVSHQVNQGTRPAGTGNNFCELCGRARDGKTFCGHCGTRFV